MSPVPASPAKDRQHRWCALIVDDDPSIRRLTTFLLGRVSLDGSGVEVLTAASSAEARDVLEARPDVAVAIIDVIMETPEAGIELASWLRTSPAHRDTRCVLHTGQPGEGREDRVRRDALVHDYWAKGTLRADRFQARFLEQLRAYRDRVAERAAGTLHCIAYRSEYVGLDRDSDLRRIRSASIARNPVIDVTGALFVAGGRFFQVLEGPPGVVRELFARIEEDERHRDVVTLIDRTIGARTFRHWVMHRLEDEPGPGGGQGAADLEALARGYGAELSGGGGGDSAILRAVLRGPAATGAPGVEGT
jgi:CheY-like chemotaxis protein